MKLKELAKTKTFWAGVGSVVVGVIGLATGKAPTETSIQYIWQGLAAIFVRDGIMKLSSK